MNSADLGSRKEGSVPCTKPEDKHFASLCASAILKPAGPLKSLLPSLLLFLLKELRPSRHKGDDLAEMLKPLCYNNVFDKVKHTLSDLILLLLSLHGSVDLVEFRFCHPLKDAIPVTTATRGKGIPALWRGQ